MSGLDAPALVSVAIPLFRSKQFLSCILGNLEAIEYPNVEIIISDRHSDDDTLDILRLKYGRDPRFTFIKRSDRLHWVDHYNLLLREASGQYFMWMPHDDSFPPTYIPQLVAALDARPQAVLAFGRINAIDLAGEPLPGWRFHPPPICGLESKDIRDSVKLLFWGAGIPFRGIFRRDVLIRKGLDIRSTSHAADVYWIFAVSLSGSFCFVSSCACDKRFYPGSTTTSTQYGMRQVMDGIKVLRSYVHDAGGSRQARIVATACVFFWGGVQLIVRGMPDILRPFAFRIAYRMLPVAIKPGLRRFGQGSRNQISPVGRA